MFLCLSMVEWLGKEVHCHNLHQKVGEQYHTVLDSFVNEMKTYVDVLGPCVVLSVFGQCYHGLVVAMDCGCCGGQRSDLPHEGV